MKPLSLALLLTSLLFSFTACNTINTGAATGTGSSFSETKLAEKAGGPVTPYPFDHCAVIQKPFAEKPARHRRIYKGQEVLFCCTPCVRAFDANPDPYMPRIVSAAGGSGQ